MESTTSTTSWGSTIIQGVIILFLVIGLIVLIYFIFSTPAPLPFPVSPFNYEDTVQISPAVPAQYGDTISPDQYLTQVVCSGSCPDCYIALQACRSCALTFSSNKQDPKTKWVLKQLSTLGADAKQNVLQFGNRFFLQNQTAVNASEFAGRVTYIPFDASCPALQGPDRTFPVSGASVVGCQQDCYDQELVVYFLPTTQPNLYYILFPGNTENPVTQDNNGVMSLRPWAPASGTDNFYFPWSGPNNTVLNNNGPMLNGLGSFVTGPFPNPEVFLFKIEKA